MSSSGSKPWLLAMGAALAIAGGIYFLHNQKKKNYMKEIMREIMREVDALGPPEKDASGKVPFGYLKALYFIADKSATERFQPLKEKFLRKRRDLLRQNKFKEYRKVVVEMSQSETQILCETQIKTMEYAGEDYFKTFNEYLENPENRSEFDKDTDDFRY